MKINVNTEKYCSGVINELVFLIRAIFQSSLLYKLKIFIETNDSPIISVSCEDNGYYANKFGRDYPGERIGISFSYTDSRNCLSNIYDDHAEKMFESEFIVAYELAAILFESWVCEFEIKTKEEELVICYTLPSIGRTETRDEEPFVRAAKFLRLGVWYGDVGQFGMDLFAGSIFFQRFRE